MGGYRRMPFGKHKGKFLSDIPEDYLQWLLDEVNLKPLLRADVEAELRRRFHHARGGGHEPPPGEAAAPGLLLANVRQIVRDWYRELSLRFHPDHGGSHERQLALNVAHDRLKELLGI